MIAALVSSRQGRARAAAPLRRRSASPMASNSARRARVLASSSSKPSAPASRATRSTSAARSGALSSSAKARARASAISAAASRSSATLKLAGTLASNGKRCSRRSQKAWIVWIFNPPGVSIARANRRRAKARPCAFGCGAPSSTIASASAASSRPVHDASVSNTRAAILAAAVLVKVRQSRPDGAAPASRSRSARWVSTWVLPEPALAETQAEAAGSEAWRWRSRTGSGISSRGALMARPPSVRRTGRRSPTIP